MRFIKPLILFICIFTVSALAEASGTTSTQSDDTNCDHNSNCKDNSGCNHNTSCNNNKECHHNQGCKDNSTCSNQSNTLGNGDKKLLDYGMTL